MTLAPYTQAIERIASAPITASVLATGAARGSRPIVSALAPDLVRKLDDQAQLRPLLVLRQDVALDGRREAALRREAELVDRRMLGRCLDTALDLVLRLELSVLRRDETEHDLLLALREETQRLEAPGEIGRAHV